MLQIRNMIFHISGQVLIVSTLDTQHMNQPPQDQGDAGQGDEEQGDAAIAAWIEAGLGHAHGEQQYGKRDGRQAGLLQKEQPAVTTADMLEGLT